MNTPTTGLNPVSASWSEAKASVKPLAKLYTVGFALMAVLGLATSQFVGAFSFVYGFDTDRFAWLPVVAILGLLLAWYSVHLMLALANHRQNKPLPNASDSLRRVPNLILAGILNLIIIVGPIAILVILLSLLTPGANAQDAFTLGQNYGESIALGSGDEAASKARLMNLFQGGIGLLVLITGLVWAVYASLRLSQTSVLVMIENMTAVNAIKRSWAMMKGHLSYVLGWGIVLGLFVFLLSIPVGIVDGVLTMVAVKLGALGLASNALSAYLTMPWATFFTLTVYERIKNAPSSHSATPAQS